MKTIFTYISFLLSLTVFSQTGLIVNEVSQGSSGAKEYVELVAIAPTGTCFIDIRNWIIDDNNGDFSGGPVTGSGVAPGHIRFTNNAQWQNLPTGSIILIYNSADKNTSIVLPDDPSDSNNDRVYILPSDSPLLEDCTSVPAVGNASYTGCTYAAAGGTTWSRVGLANDGDVIQVRTNTSAFFHGIAFGDGGCNCITGIAGGPMVDPCTAAGCTAGKVYSFTHGTNNDYTLAANYSIGTVPANETPGSTNNAANNTWRNSLLCPLPLPAITLKSTLMDNHVVLHYQRTQEEYSKNIILEHSTVTTAWEAIADMNYTSTYTHTLYDNETHFYRILFQDKDGNTKISNVVSATVSSAQNQDITVYPNPVSDVVNIALKQAEGGSMQVFNLAGQKVYQSDIQNGTLIHTIDTQNWNKGMYIVRFISNQGNTFMQKFIKADN